MHSRLLDRWNAISLRTKITGVTVLMLTLGLLVTGIGTMSMLKPVLLDQLDAQLSAASGASYLNTYLYGTSSDSEKIASDASPSDYFAALYDADGNLVKTNWTNIPSSHRPAVPETLSVADGKKLPAGGYPLQSNDGRTTYRALAQTVTLTNPPGALGTAIVATTTTQIDTVMASFLAIFLGFGVIVIIVGAGLTRMLVTTTFQPLREVEQTAARIADGDFSQRLGGATPNTEVGRLNRSLNTMLNRIDRAFSDRARTIDQMRRFVGDASHELRTPLVSVRGYAELYRMGALQTPEDVGQAMERIEKEAIRMGILVEDLLELARLDEAKPLDLHAVDLVRIAQDAAMDAMAGSPGRIVTVLTPDPVPAAVPSTDPDEPTLDTVPMPLSELPSSASAAKVSNATGPIAFAGSALARLRRSRPRRGTEPIPITTTEKVVLANPAPAEPAIVLAEENKLRQVVTNLMGNALRYTPVDSPIEIAVQIDHRTERASLEVRDHGEGIPPQIREKIFQRFWRADTSRARETGGSGLGLAIVSSIVAAHNGTVDVSETEGGGATFRVTLPLAGSPAAPKPLQA
ncbi:sensor histidine kinase [Leifsonia aquatica]|jgi:two-component system OmpR family sensor kinase|uniref:histidine kinase n=2 Tax=Leifsonia aquatica TaxID=144185 RepID=U2SW54_LEIAQ|nr:HAMP domain-containing sensor histidine kinase [Leifsonia aquatica]ERK69498.1 ATPase/histidine kinase/DNA gyrase B/HSP90 domain protein [Leifsonia aquatica ATCC 14665]MBB2969376.1 two-component system OmpR family sensor kinase [Leifsonia aquatica]